MVNANLRRDKKQRLISFEFMDKPAAASDIQNLEHAWDVIQNLRLLIRDFGITQEDVENYNQRGGNHVSRTRQTERKALSSGLMVPPVPQDRRVLNKVPSNKRDRGIIAIDCASGEYIKKTFEKSAGVREIILSSIKLNVLFRGCAHEELIDIVDAFEPENFPPGAIVIRQGDSGHHFYIVETGSLDIFVRAGSDSCDGEMVRAAERVGSPYVRGESFGELALMYETPRAATIATREECKLWKIDRAQFRDIVRRHKLEKDGSSRDILKDVTVGGGRLVDVFGPRDFQNLASIVQRKTFGRGNVIVREGRKGDIFYKIQSGTVDLYTMKNGRDPLKKLTRGQFFGERALVSEEIRTGTCVASSDEVVCLYLVREDFVRIFGGIETLLRKKRRRGALRRQSTSYHSLPEMTTADAATDAAKPAPWKLSDLDVMETLGMGTFGRVRLVKMIETGQNYALKCISKALMVRGNLQKAVSREHECLAVLGDHPFVVKSFGSVQDDRYIYLRMEVLLGGEFYTVLRQRERLSEEFSRFYTASVVAAFDHIHRNNITYRDLKPENLALDSAGYLKVIDFGFAKIFEGKTYTFCGTFDYIAPEVITTEGHGTGVDYWALGVLLYEMITGDVPFKGSSSLELFKEIVQGHVDNSVHFSKNVFDLIQKLLTVSQQERLGNIYGGAETVMKHKWFIGFDLDGLLKKELRAPFKPKLKDADDTSNFDRYSEDVNDVPDYPSWQPDFAAVEETCKERPHETKCVSFRDVKKNNVENEKISPKKEMVLPEKRAISICPITDLACLMDKITSHPTRKDLLVKTQRVRRKERFERMTTAPIYMDDNRSFGNRLASTYGWYRHQQKRSELDDKAIKSMGFGKAMLACPENNSELEPINILCMDGGGMKGYALLAMLEEFADMCGGKDIMEMFDLMGGTSVGGLAALTLGHSKSFAEGYRTGLDWADQLREKTFAKKDFAQLVWKGFLLADRRKEIFRGLFGERITYVDHENEGGVRAFAVCVRREISEFSGRSSPSSSGGGHTDDKDRLEPFLVRTYEIPADSSDKEALSGTHKLPLYMSMTATSAAPGAFDRTRAKIGGVNYQLCDGMLVANSPVIIAVREAKLLWPDRPIGNIVSFGLDDTETSSNVEALSMIKTKNPNMNFFRLMPPIDGFSAIETDLDIIAHYKELAKNYIKTSDVAKEACKALMHASSITRESSTYFDSITRESSAYFDCQSTMDLCANEDSEA